MTRIETAMARKVTSVLASAALAVSLVPTPAFAADGLSAAGIEEETDVVVSADDLHYTAGSYVAGEILVEYDNASASGLVRGMGLGMTSAALEREAGVEVVKTVIAADDRTGTVVKAETPENMSIEEAVAAARNVEGVKNAQPNFRYELFDGWDEGDSAEFRETVGLSESDDRLSVEAVSGTNDKYLTRQYYLGSWEEEHGVGVTDAWEWARCEGEVTIAVIDTGCAVNHADLADQVVTDFMWDAYSNTKPGTIISGNVPLGDNSGHGTHVCGIAAATADNKIGIAGASYNANILPIKVFDNKSTNPGAETETIAEAYKYIKDLKDNTSITGEAKEKIDNLHVINMSLGGYGDTDGDDDMLLKDYISDLRDNYQVLTVVAGGNGNRDGTPRTDPSFPSDYEDSFAVTATNSSGENVVWSDYNQYKDISAPGYDIFSTYPGDDEEDVSYFTSLNGTSMASPLVAGCAALLWAAYPGATPDEVVEAIRETANEPVWGGNNYDTDRQASTGSAGVIDVEAAVQKILEDNAGVHRVRMKACAVADVADQVYTGRAVQPQLKVTYTDESGKTVKLEQGKDYTLDYRDNRNVGKASVSVIGRNTYIGRTSVDFRIKYDIASASANTTQKEYEFTGKAIEPKLNVTHQGSALAEGRDYTVSYRDNDEPGTGTVVVQGIGDKYMNKAETTFSIVDKRPSLANASIASISERTYTGKAIEPDPTVKMGSKKLTKGTDYTVDYIDNVNPGLAVARVKGVGSYGGQKLAVFRISASKNIAAASVSVADATYTGKALKPKVTVKSGNATVPASAYTVTYKNNTNVGLATVTVQGKGAYSGSKSATFAINPKAAAAKKATGGSKAVTLTWVKQPKQVSGYQIMYAANKKFTGSKTVNVKGAAKASGTVKGLKAKTAYYLKVRTYTTVKGKTYYSTWSKVLSAKTR